MDSKVQYTDKDKALIGKATQTLFLSFQDHERQRNSISIPKIEMALDIALKAHQGMYRKSGAPFVLHPIAVATIVSKEFKLGTLSIVCALLHDVLEDTDFSQHAIKQTFGEQAMNILHDLTRITFIENINANHNAYEDFLRTYVKVAKDIRVLFIKLADRLHNIRTLSSMSLEKQKKVAMETLYIFAPLAYKLGINSVKSELQDTALKHLDPEQYYSIRNYLQNNDKERTFSQNLHKQIQEHLKQIGANCEVVSRRKSIYSIHEKLERKECSIEEIRDLYGIRVIIDNIDENKAQNATLACWDIMRQIKTLVNLDESTLKDWISLQKDNGYQAIQAKVRDVNNNITQTEIQIKTRRMHEIAEQGMASHWSYKNKGKVHTEIEEIIDRAKGVIQRHNMELPNDNYHEQVENEKNTIVCVSPKGKFFFLPKDSTIIDFAFALHEELAFVCTGAIVNKCMYSNVDYILQNGDMVDLIGSPNQEEQVKLEWLAFVKTKKAIKKIKKQLEPTLANYQVAGEVALKDFFDENNIKRNKDQAKYIETLKQQDHGKLLQFLSITQLIGAGKISLNNPKAEDTNHQFLTNIPNGVSTHCVCFDGKINKERTIPVIIGKRKLANGQQLLEAHLQHCLLITQEQDFFPLQSIETKLVKVENFIATMRIIASKNLHMLADITRVLCYETNTDILALKSLTRPNNLVECRLLVQVQHPDVLEYSITRLRDFSNIIDISLIKTDNFDIFRD